MDLHLLLVKLETLLTTEDFDPEDRALMKQYMIEVSNFEALLVMRENPVFIGLMASFTEEIKAINHWIILNAVELAGNIPSPVKEKATQLIAKRSVLKEFIDHYSAEPVELVRHIEQRVSYFYEKIKH